MRLVAVALVASAVLLVGTSSAFGYAAFRTPGEAAYCGTSEGDVPPYVLTCWTPNDGFTISMTRRSKPRFGYMRSHRGYVQNLAGVLQFGDVWRSEPFICTSRNTGVTCVNARGHGWWLGRYIGYRVF